MKQTIRTIIVTLCLTVFAGMIPVFAQEEKKQPTMEELAAKEADRLGELLDLEDWQIFYVDSTLQHDYNALDAEIKSLQSAKVGNQDLYLSVQDKWMDQIDNTYQKFFTEEQWARYLKSGAARNRKAREKRKEKAAKADAIRKK